MFFWLFVLGAVCLVLVVSLEILHSVNGRMRMSSIQAQLRKEEMDENKKSTIVVKDVPMAKGNLPIIKHMYTIASLPNEDFHMPYFLQWFKDLNSTIVQIQMPINVRSYITIDPDIVKYMISTTFKKQVFGKGDGFIKQFEDFLGQGIFNVNGDKWREHRDVAKALFHTANLKNYISIFHQNSIALFDKINTIQQQQKQLLDTSSIPMKGIDMQDMFFRYTLDSFAEIGFGVKLHSIQQEVNNFAIAFDIVQTHSDRRGRIGNLWKIKEAIFPPKKYLSALKYMNDYTHQIISARRGENESQLATRSDLLSQLILANKGKEDNEAFQKKLRDFVMNFLIAGRDTTAMLLTMTVYYLAKHPQVEEKVLQEIATVVGSDSEIEWSQVKSLKYLHAVLKETLRLAPPVPFDGYTAFEDTVVPGGYFIPKGGDLFYSAYMIHRQESLYSQANEFIPERWLKDSAKYTTATVSDHPFAYLPFHGGPRVCMGMEMAYTEAKVMLCNLLPKYKITVSQFHKHQLKHCLILTTKNGMLLHLTPRSFDA